MQQYGALERERVMKKPNAKNKIVASDRGIGKKPTILLAKNHSCSTIPASQRIVENPGQGLVERPKGTLYCTFCSEVVNKDSTILKNHLRSKKHRTKRLKLGKIKPSYTPSVKDVLLSMKEHPAGSTIPQVQIDYRIECLKTWMSALLPLAKIDEVRHLFEKNNYALTDSSNLAQWIPVILKQEWMTLQNEVEGLQIGIVFDGTTKVAEVYCFVVRFVDPENYKCVFCWYLCPIVA